MTTNWEYVETDDALARVVADCMAARVVAVDTEFARSHTYYPNVGLIQIYTGKQCFLIDPLPLATLDRVGDLLASPDVLKVLHACSEDLEVFQYAVGVLPDPVFDTQIAAAALGIGFSLSYQSLVEHHLDVSVPKEETRSDWLQRPLSEAQLEYAALDVIHLLEVFERQEAALASAGKRHWVDEECRVLEEEVAITARPDQCYLRVKAATRMRSEELNRLQALCAWRETRARELNKPRNRVVDEKALVALARSDVHDKAGLASVAGLTPRQVRKFGDEILFLLAEARLVPDSRHPAPIDDLAGTRVRKEQMKRLRKIVERRAESLNVAPEMLARRRHLEALLRTADEDGNYALPDALNGWRRPVIGDHLLAELEGESR